jgi:hypothetical protein
MVISRAVVGKKIFGRQTDGVQALGNDYTHGPTIPGPDYIHGHTVTVLGFFGGDVTSISRSTSALDLHLLAARSLA